MRKTMKNAIEVLFSFLWMVAVVGTLYLPLLPIVIHEVEDANINAGTVTLGWISVNGSEYRYAIIPKDIHEVFEYCQH